MDDVRLRPPPPLAKRLALLIGILVVIGLGVVLAGRVGEALQEQAALEAEREDSAEAAGAAPEVTVVRPETTETAPFVVLTGTLEPAHAADLAFEAAGRVARVDVTLGQEVEEGDVIATLDRSSVGAQSAQSAASIRVAEANVEMARDRVTLLERLTRSGGAPERDLITARQQLAVSEAQLSQARASRRTVAATSADHVLRAPFDGVVTRVPSGVGVAATPGMPLARVEDLTSLRLRTTVNRHELQALRVGAPVTLEGSDVQGTIETVVRSLDVDTRRAPVEVRVPNEDGALVANAFVRAHITVGERRPVLRIPGTALRPDSTVLVVGEGSRLEARAVTADLGPEGTWLVSDGLSPESRVVLRPATTTEGTVVAPVEPPQAQVTAGLVP